jgi:phosphate transport system substrate-binding protein
MKARNTFSAGLFKSAVIAAFIFSTGWQLSARDQKNQINIHVEKSLTPLAERWISDFMKSNPGFNINLVDQNNSEPQVLRIFESHEAGPFSNENEVVYLVGQQAILPIINEQNPYFSRELKRGIRQNQLKEIFFNTESDGLFEEEIKKEPDYEIYTPVPHSSSAEAFAEFFDKPSSELKGIFVSGDDSHILSAILQDPAGITYTKMSLVYNPDTREPITGIRVLPVDLNNNGRLDKSELVFDNLDQLIQYTGNSRNPMLPTLQILLSTHKENLENPDISHFINWTIGEGQKTNTHLGYFKNGETNSGELTQK